MAVDLMDLHQSAGLMHRQACLMIRNMAVRNPENRSTFFLFPWKWSNGSSSQFATFSLSFRPLLLEKGVEPLLRRAKAQLSQCKEVASAALRDLGFDDYL